MDGVGTFEGFCYSGDRINTSGGCEVVVKTRARFGGMRLSECREILHGKKFP